MAVNVHARAWIDLKICMVNSWYVDILSLKFEKGPFGGCGEIGDLLALDLSPTVTSSCSLVR